MPTYDISDETHTKVTVHGELIDENYTDILNNNPDLPLEDFLFYPFVEVVGYRRSLIPEAEAANENGDGDGGSEYSDFNIADFLT
jgi:hypothetical protein